MKPENVSLDQKQKAPNICESTTVAALNQPQKDYKPSPDAVAKKAYFSYLNGGSKSGQAEKHWLEAEAQLFSGIDGEMQILPR